MSCMHARIHTCACIHKTNIHVCVGTHRHRYVCVYIYIYVFIQNSKAWFQVSCGISLGSFVLPSAWYGAGFQQPEPLLPKPCTRNDPELTPIPEPWTPPHPASQTPRHCPQSPSAVASVEIPHAPLAGCCEDFSADGFKVQVLAFDHDQRFGLRISWKLGMHGFVPKNC